jgi:DnaJ-class molecular chaperone
MNKYHRIVEPFDCPKCKGEGENIQINDLASWLTHTSDVHGCNGQTGVVIDKECLLKQGQKKRKRENIVEEAIKRSKLES